MTGANKIKKFGSKMKIYAQVLGVKEKQKEPKTTATKEKTKNTEKEMNLKSNQNEINRLNDAITVLQKKIDGFIQLINELVIDKYSENIVQKEAIYEKVQKIASIDKDDEIEKRSNGGYPKSTKQWNQEENKTKEKEMNSTKKAKFKATSSCKH